MVLVKSARPERLWQVSRPRDLRNDSRGQTELANVDGAELSQDEKVQLGGKHGEHILAKICNALQVEAVLEKVVLPFAGPFAALNVECENRGICGHVIRIGNSRAGTKAAKGMVISQRPIPAEIPREEEAAWGERHARQEVE